VRPTFHLMKYDLIIGVHLSLELDLHTSGMLRGNSYVYMKDLLALDSCRPLDTTEFVLDWEARSHSINLCGQPYLSITQIAPLWNTF